MGLRGPKGRPLAERFWERVERRSGTDCWPWVGYLDENGYGRISEGGYCSKLLGAHRVSWEIVNGPIPEGSGYHGTCVLHRCDNPKCVNPDHLFIGSHLDNIADMKAKGRANGGPGPLTTDRMFVNSYFDRHGKPRYYFRRGKAARRALKGQPGSPEFESAYRAALADENVS